MNPQHLQAFLGLRWRLFVNQLKRGGIANAVILALLAVIAGLLDLALFIGCFLVGLLILPEASPAVVMYVWDGLVLFFLFWWGIGILTDLQRSEALSLDKFLHLPVSISGAFLINYLSSLLNLSMLFFLPAMVTLTLGLACALGPIMLLLLPLLVGFFFMITALTYQFQGWLASLMVNKRRRQTIIVMITMSMILLCQLPNMLNLTGAWGQSKPDERFTLHLQQQSDLREALKARQITGEQFKEKIEKLQSAYDTQNREQKRQTQETLEEAVHWGNLSLPPGWLPLGAKYLAQGNILPALLGTLGLTLIGAASLWRAYRTTLHYYTGKFSGGKKPAAPAPIVKIDHSPAFFMEKKILWVSEQTAAIALVGLKSLLRAPEAKMMLLSPIIMVAVFGSMFMVQASNIPRVIWPLLPSAAMGMILLSMVNFAGNQFGFDRNGFRVFVLCPAPRQDILLGKNLAIAPLTLGLGGTLALVLAIVFPMRWDFLLALPAHLFSMFLVFCLMANWLSIFCPIPIRAGSFKASHPKGLAILLNLAFVFLFPLALLPTLLPLGIEILVKSQGYMEGMPICLVLTLLECAAIWLLYRLVLTWQGNFLQDREQKILETVAVKSD